MNVLHFVSLKGIGGVQTQFSETFDLLCMKDIGRRHLIITKEIDHQYKSVTKYIKSLSKISDIFVIISLLVFQRNILHIYNRTGSKWIWLISIIAIKSKIILHERGNIWNADEIKLKVCKRNCSLADRIVVNSNATSLYLQKRCGAEPGKIAVIHNGIKNRVEMSNSATKQPESTKLRVAFVGRIEPHKGLISLLNAFDLLSKDKFSLDVIGDGVLFSAYRSTYLDRDNVRFLGRKEKIVEYLSSYVDVLVVPSIREPLGNVCLEGGLSGCAVVASNVDGIPEVIEHMQSGFLITPDVPIREQTKFSTGGVIPEYVLSPTDGELIPPKQLDPKKIADTLVLLQKDRKLCKFLAHNLKQKVFREFTEDCFLMKLVRVYDSI